MLGRPGMIGRPGELRGIRIVGRAGMLRWSGVLRWAGELWSRRRGDFAALAIFLAGGLGRVVAFSFHWLFAGVFATVLDRFEGFFDAKPARFRQLLVQERLKDLAGVLGRLQAPVCALVSRTIIAVFVRWLFFFHLVSTAIQQGVEGSLKSVKRVLRKQSFGDEALDDPDCHLIGFGAGGRRLGGDAARLAGAYERYRHHHQSRVH
jgi:hypothetical protein